MHVLEAALVGNLGLGRQENAIAGSNSPKGGLPSVLRLVAAVVAIGLVVVGLNSASTDAAHEGEATTARAEGP